LLETVHVKWLLFSWVSMHSRLC